MRYILALALLCTCTAATVSTPAPRDTSEKVRVARILRSTLMVRVMSVDPMTNKLQMGGGSGFIAAHKDGSTFVVTAGHVCDPAPMAIKLTDIGGFEYNAEVAYSDQDQEVCVLKTPGEIGMVTPLSRETPYLGAPVVFAGAPKGVFDRNAAVVADARYCGVTDYAGMRVAVLSSVTTSGASGSGVHFEGAVIGIVVAVANPMGTPIFVVPAEVVSGALKKAHAL